MSNATTVHGTATADAFAYELAVSMCKFFIGWSKIILEAGGGPLDAPNYIAAGSCNSTEWCKGGSGDPVPSMTTTRRYGAKHSPL